MLLNQQKKMRKYTHKKAKNQKQFDGIVTQIRTKN